MASRATFRFTDKDRGLLAMRRRLAEAGRRVVKVGIFGAAASADHDGLSNVDVASFHEFGTENIPQRSFIRATVDQNRQSISKTQGQVARGILKGRISETRGLGLIGAQVQGMIQKAISDRIPPPLKAATIAAKGSSVPLIDTGQLRQSIAWEVVPR